MKSALLALALAVPAAMAQAETPMTADEFEAFVTGKTMDYISRGAVYGREVYLPGRKVRWAFTADECRSGYWYGEGEQICFLYDGLPVPECWIVWQDGNGLAASHARDTPDMAPRQVLETNEPLACEGPDVGV